MKNYEKKERGKEMLKHKMNLEKINESENK